MSVASFSKCVECLPYFAYFYSLTPASLVVPVHRTLPYKASQSESSSSALNRSFFLIRNDECPVDSGVSQPADAVTPFATLTFVLSALNKELFGVLVIDCSPTARDDNDECAGVVPFFPAGAGASSPSPFPPPDASKSCDSEPRGRKSLSLSFSDDAAVGELEKDAFRLRRESFNIDRSSASSSNLSEGVKSC